MEPLGSATGMDLGAMLRRLAVEKAEKTPPPPIGAITISE